MDAAAGPATRTAFGATSRSATGTRRPHRAEPAGDGRPTGPTRGVASGGLPAAASAPADAARTRPGTARTAVRTRPGTARTAARTDTTG
jgi:hypothetical protein